MHRLDSVRDNLQGNRDVRAFPGSVVASMLGFPKRDYLADRPEKAEVPQDIFKK